MSRTRGVVAAGHVLTARAAESVLREGGNAFDAVVAALATACVAEPVLASPGGGGFLLAQPADERARVYDFFVQTPVRPRALADIEFFPITADFGETTQEFHVGRGTIAVPGMLRGMQAVHDDLGRMSMRDLFAPACELARAGVRVTDFQAYLFGVVQAVYRASPAMFACYRSHADPSAMVAAGETLSQPQLGDALEAISIEGADLLYRGEMGARLLADLRDAGQLTRADLEGYRVERREPLSLDYRGARVLTNPPPSSGGTLAMLALRLLADCSPASLGAGSPDWLALLAEVMRLCAEARMDAAAKDPGAAAGLLLADAFVDRWRQQLAARPRAFRGTTHVSVIDGEGNLASATVSNGEGAAYLIPGTGIVMNNMLGEEDLNPGGFQRWPGGARMTSMMMPSAVLWPDGRRIATGSGGSNRIRSAVLQVLLNVLEFDLDIEQAVHAPRVHVEGELLSVEGGFDVERLAPLLEHWPRHHLWSAANLFFGGAHTVEYRNGDWHGAGDPRRDGASISL